MLSAYNSPNSLIVHQLLLGHSLKHVCNSMAGNLRCSVSKLSKSNFDTEHLGLPGDGKLEIGILCRESHWQLSSIEQVCNSLHPLFTVEDQSLLPFSAVKNLFVSYKFAPGIAAAMEELDGGRITKVLSRLQDIFVEELEALGSFQENIRRFVAARQLPDHLIVISDWDRHS